jgi:beta-lactam-binding protein with PASTA domain
VSVQEGQGTSQNLQPGTVYATSPGPGSKLPQGGNIIIFVVQPQISPTPSA